MPQSQKDLCRIGLPYFEGSESNLVVLGLVSHTNSHTVSKQIYPEQDLIVYPKTRNITSHLSLPSVASGVNLDYSHLTTLLCLSRFLIPL